MAAAIECDLCKTEPAEMMQTNLANGQTISVGGACMVTFFAGALTAMLEQETPKQLNALRPVLVPLAAVIGPDKWDAESDTVKAVRAAPEASQAHTVTADEMADLKTAAGFTQAYDDPESVQP